jgi:predicted 3-demethylubiquinone-9 3-methyltransferase (glyoxalase superfamily)
MDKISPCLWCNFNAEEQVNFYVSLLPDSRVDRVVRWPMDGSGPNAGRKKGDTLVIDFTLGGRKFIGLVGGPKFPYTEAFSMSVTCDDQAEVDRLWAKLTADGGKEVACGWLKDKYGLAWQIVPKRMYELLADNDTTKAARAISAMMQMVKLDIAKIEAAAKG